jgi:hypothetical protein
LPRTKLRERWWQKPIKEGRFTRAHVFVFTLAVMVLVEILSSPLVRIWFGLLIMGSLLVAIFLQWSDENDEL